MGRKRKNPDTSSAIIKFTPEALKIIHDRQSESLAETGVLLNIERIVNKIILGK